MTCFQRPCFVKSGNLYRLPGSQIFIVTHPLVFQVVPDLLCFFFSSSWSMCEHDGQPNREDYFASEGWDGQYYGHWYSLSDHGEFKNHRVITVSGTRVWLVLLPRVFAYRKIFGGCILKERNNNTIMLKLVSFLLSSMSHFCSRRIIFIHHNLISGHPWYSVTLDACTLSWKFLTILKQMCTLRLKPYILVCNESHQTILKNLKYLTTTLRKRKIVIAFDSQIDISIFPQILLIPH